MSRAFFAEIEGCNKDSRDDLSYRVYSKRPMVHVVSLPVVVIAMNLVLINSQTSYTDSIFMSGIVETTSTFTGTSTTDMTSATAAAFTASGGVYIGNKAYVGTKMGVGTTTPDEALTVSGNLRADDFYTGTDSSSGLRFCTYRGSTTTYAYFGHRARCTSTSCSCSGNLGFAVKYSGYVYLSMATSMDMVFAVNNQHIMTLRGSTNTVGVGTQTPSASYALDVVGAIRGSSSFVTTSDRRLKHNIVPLNRTSLSKVLTLVPVSYKWNMDVFPEKPSPDNQREQTGFVAQEVQEVVPEVVTEDDDGYFSVSYDGIVPLVVDAIQEQMAESEEQQVHLDHQQQQIDRHEARIQQEMNNIETLLKKGEELPESLQYLQHIHTQLLQQEEAVVELEQRAKEADCEHGGDNP